MSSIPKIIHYCWVGGGPIPEEHQRYIESWHKYCPDYEIRRWDESNYDFTQNRYMKEAYEAKKWGFVPDYARLDIIYRYGGVYLDTDVELLRPLDELLELKGFMGFEDEHQVALGLGFGAQPGCELIRKLRDDYESRTFLRPDGSLDLEASPVLNTRVLLAQGLIPNGRGQQVDGVTVLPSEYLCPMRPGTGLLCVTDKTVSIHHYAASWADEEKQRQIRRRIEISRRFGPWAGNVYVTLSVLRHEGLRECVRKVLLFSGLGEKLTRKKK